MTSRRSQIVEAARDGDWSECVLLIEEATASHPFLQSEKGLLSAMLDLDAPDYVVASLIKAGYSVGDFGSIPSPFERCLEDFRLSERKAAIARILLECGVDANASLSTGRMPLTEAVARDIPELVGILLDHGADPNKLDVHGIESTSPLTLAREKRNAASLMLLKRVASTKNERRTRTA